MNDTLNEAATLDPDALAAGLANEHAADIVERLNAEPLETASAVLSAMPLGRAVEVLDEPGLERGADLVEAQTPERATALLSAISAVAQRSSGISKNRSATVSWPGST
jgi:magnesium transporter